jgi:hypothetical protein
MLGMEVRLPFQVTQGGSPMGGWEAKCAPADYILGVRKKMQQAHQVARKHLENSYRQRKQLYDYRVMTLMTWFGIRRTCAEEVSALSYSLLILVLARSKENLVT